MSGKEQIILKIENAERLIPEVLVPDLPGQEECPDIPEWYSFEHSVWSAGEQIRSIFKNNPKLKKDPEIQEKILEICLRPEAKRGRQSFLLLLGSTHCSNYSDEIADLLKDDNVCGHAIDTLLKMNAGNYVKQIEPLTSHKITWIRNNAKKYIQKYKGL